MLSITFAGGIHHFCIIIGGCGCNCSSINICLLLFLAITGSIVTNQAKTSSRHPQDLSTWGHKCIKTVWKYNIYKECFKARKKTSKYFKSWIYSRWIKNNLLSYVWQFRLNNQSINLNTKSNINWLVANIHNKCVDNCCTRNYYLLSPYFKINKNYL